MSSTASTDAGSQESAETHRRSAPPVVQLSEEAVADGSLEPLAGTITLLWTRSSGDDVLADVERAALVDDPEHSAAVSEQLTDALDRVDEADRSADDRSRPATFDLEYAGRTLATGLPRAGFEPVGAARLPFNGGELDDTAFRVHEHGPADALDDEFEYLVLAVPPVLDEGEQSTTEVIPDDATASISVGERALALALNNVLVPTVTAMPTYVLIADQLSDGLSDGVSVDGIDENPSLDELLEARA